MIFGERMQHLKKKIEDFFFFYPPILYHGFKSLMKKFQPGSIWNVISNVIWIFTWNTIGIVIRNVVKMGNWEWN